jgi:asparagine synthetase B (glutamine-hydrolysing)
VRPGEKLHKLAHALRGAGTGAPDGGTVGKWALRQILHKHVPRELIDRPKAGFAIPIGQWLRGPLRPWAEELLSESRLRAEGYLNPGPVREAWAEGMLYDVVP